MAEPRPGSFSFLFRTDQGRIDRAVWWRGVVPLAIIAAVATAIWLALEPYAHHDLARSQFMAPATILAFAYLTIYAFGMIILAVCYYNLSAKRLRDRGRPAALAAAVPLGAFLAGATWWFIPRSFGSVPEWAGPAAVGLVLVIAVATTIDLGFGSSRERP